MLFDVPLSHRERFQWRAGQHITLRFRLAGAEARRSYSVSETPCSSAPLRITVKRVPGGLVSNYINEHVAPGDSMEVMPPFGGFCLNPDPRARRTYYFFGAGSGITPLYAMICSVLAAEPHSAVRLAYGNVNTESTIFREALIRLEHEFGSRFAIRHALSAQSSTGHWRRGRIDAESVADFINELPPYAQDTRYYVCGPGGMNATVREALKSLDVPDSRIYTESYGAVEPPDHSVRGVAASCAVRLSGDTLHVLVAEGQTLLEAVRAAGGTPKYSCESGVCGACRAILREGTVHMRARMALTDAEVAGDVVLTCQALPTTPRLTVDYD